MAGWKYSGGTALSPEETDLSGALQSWPALLPGWVSQSVSAAPLVLHQREGGPGASRVYK